MKHFILQLYTRFKSAVPPFERKLQLTCAALTTATTSMAAIDWPEHLVFIGTISGYIAAIAGGIAIAMQFAEKITDADDTHIPDNNNKTPDYE